MKTITTTLLQNNQLLCFRNGMRATIGRYETKFHGQVRTARLLCLTKNLNNQLPPPSVAAAKKFLQRKKKKV